MNLLVDWLAFFATRQKHKRSRDSCKPMKNPRKRQCKSSSFVLSLFSTEFDENFSSSYSNHITAARSMSRDKKKGEIMQQYIHVVHHPTAETAANSVAREVEFNFAEKKIIEIFHVQLITQFLFLSGSFATTSCMYDCRVSPSESFVLCFGVY
jgi:hypothetical protein